jgi:hypothetical protein
VRRLGGLTLLAAALLAMPACKGQGPQAKGSNHLYGKVTFNGAPVPYGFVLVYRLNEGEKDFDPKTSTFKPEASSGINSDGTYDIPDAPQGRIHIVVATDPDVPPHLLMEPTTLMAGMEHKGPGKSDNPDADKGPPVINKTPRGQKGPPEPKKGPLPPGAKAPQGWANPAMEKMTEDQIKTLKTIHSKYGALGRSPLMLEVTQPDTKFDIKLN